MSPLVKVCGLVRAEDVRLAADLGADLLGFVRYPPSPRHCADLSVAHPYLDRAVLVMVADHGEEILEMVLRHGFRRVQPHLPPERREAGVRLLRGAGLALLLPYLWEPGTTTTGGAGGAGATHAMAYPPPGDFLLAGGLDATNLAGRVASIPASARAGFRGADAASRLEAGPGRKDPARVAAFIQSTHALELP